jgi:hypothetical protein
MSTSSEESGLVTDVLEPEEMSKETHQRYEKLHQFFDGKGNIWIPWFCDMVKAIVKPSV